MTIIKTISLILLAYTVIYIILKAIATNEEYQKSLHQPAEIRELVQPKKIQVEIVSNDLYMKAENMIATHDVLALQAEQIQHEINTTEKQLQAERVSMICDKSEIQRLIKHSLNLQQNKCKLEAQMIKLMDELDKIAHEEYKGNRWSNVNIVCTHATIN